MAAMSVEGGVDGLSRPISFLDIFMKKLEPRSIIQK